jgi:periplasmic copper chaperone A
MRTNNFSASLFLLLLLSDSAFSLELNTQADRLESVATNSQLVIINAYAPQVPPVSRTAAVYLTLYNRSADDVVLTGLRTNIAQMAMMHQSLEENSVVKMKHLREIIVPAHSKLIFSEGDRHIMLMGLIKPLSERPFELVLEFEGGVELNTLVNVKPKAH